MGEYSEIELLREEAIAAIRNIGDMIIETRTAGEALDQIRAELDAANILIGSKMVTPNG